MEMFSTFLCISGVLISSSVLKKFSEQPVDQDKQKLDDFFKTTNFCNKKENPEFAKVSWVKDYSNFKIFKVEIPVGCDVNVLLRMQYALENLFKNDVEILSLPPKGLPHPQALHHPPWLGHHPLSFLSVEILGSAKPRSENAIDFPLFIYL